MTEYGQQHTERSTFFYGGFSCSDKGAIKEINGGICLVFCLEANEGEAAEFAVGGVLELDICDVSLGAERLSQRLLGHLRAAEGRSDEFLISGPGPGE